MNEVKRVVEIAERGTTITQIPQQSESSAIIHLIERAARDPSVDIAKLNQLLELRTKIEDREARRSFDAAMTAAQADMRPVATDSNNPQTKSKYASYFALDKAIRPIYTKHGFSPTFNTGDATDASSVRVLCSVSHRDGHVREYHLDMPADGKGAKGGDVMTKTHATGSAITYGRRYLLTMIFNIAVGDDDGNTAGGETISEEQATELEKLIKDTGGDVVKFCEFAKVGALVEIGAARFEAAKDAINRAAKARAAKKATEK